MMSFICRVASDLRSVVLLVRFVAALFLAVTIYSLGLLFLPKAFWWRVIISKIGWLCLWAGGQKLTIHGSPPSIEDGPYLFILNHQSFFDGFVVARSFPYRVTGLGAKSYFNLPLWGWMMKLHGIISVDRSDHEGALASIKKTEEAFRRGESLAIFPEGTRTPDGKLQDFKTGAFHLAISAKATIVPVAIIGAAAAWPKGSWRIKPGRLAVAFGQPISYANYGKLYVGENAVSNLKSLTRLRITALMERPQ
jgi:1-acyl-sn-glycerol-3-phosphate acyltransferase